MQLRNFVVLRNVWVLVVEKWRGVQPIRPAMQISLPVNRIGSGRRAHVDVRAAGRALLRVVHRRVHAKFLQSSPEPEWATPARSPDTATPCSESVRPACWCRLRPADAGVVHNARGSHLAGAFSVEQIAGIHAVQQKRVAGVALAVRPDRLVAQSAVRAGAAGEFRVHARRKNRQPRETARRQGNVLESAVLRERSRWSYPRHSAAASPRRSIVVPT